jgi:beta-carotene 15,15'-dioxygenase
MGHVGVPPRNAVDASRAIHALHRAAAIAVAGLVILISMFGWSPTAEMALVVAALAASIGLPHGALDVAIGPALLDRRLYFALYGALAALMVGLWFALPPVALALFFAMSWFHFGAGDVPAEALDQRTGLLHGVATGGLVVGLPLVAHAEVTSRVLDPLLLGRGDFGPVAAVAWGTVILAVAIPAATLAVLGHMRSRSWMLVGEIVALAVLGLVAHPLVSFAVYFVAFHSPRHLIEMSPQRSSIMPTALASIATIGSSAVLWVVVEPSVTTTIRIVFIGLAALTVPHLLTTLGLARAKRMPVRQAVPIRRPAPSIGRRDAAA